MTTLFTGEILLQVSHFCNTSIQTRLYVQSLLFFIVVKYTLYKIYELRHF